MLKQTTDEENRKRNGKHLFHDVSRENEAPAELAPDVEPEESKGIKQGGKG